MIPTLLLLYRNNIFINNSLKYYTVRFESLKKLQIAFRVVIENSEDFLPLLK